MSGIYKNVDIVVGGQAGSEGKGKIAGALVKRNKYELAICDFAPNAGHTWRDGDRKVVVRQIPIAHIDPDVKLAIAPGAVIDLKLLLAEIKQFDVGDRITIDPRAVVTSQANKDHEARVLTRIASTCKGAGSALAGKVMRGSDVVLARDVPSLQKYIKPVLESIKEVTGLILVEGAQGYDLDLDFGLEYPYCTSRHTTPAAIVARCGINFRRLRHVWAVVRTYPIRVGNVVRDGVQIGYSGDYADSNEITFGEIAERANMATVPAEFTTVTGKPRRIFEFSYERFEQMLAQTGATHIALTFADYLDAGLSGCNDSSILNYEAYNLFMYRLNVALHNNKADLGFIGTGPDNSDAVWNTTVL